MKRKRQVVLVLIIMFLCIVIINMSIKAALPQFKISPSRFEILLEPQARTIQTINISNAGIDVLNLTALTQDWDVNENGDLVLKEPVTSTRSASNWIRFNPKNIKAEPGKEQVIRFAVTAPPDVEPGEYRTAILLTFEETFTSEAEINIRPQFAILLYINIPEVNRTGEIEKAEISVNDEGMYFARGDIKSTGNAHIRITGEYVLQNNSGQEVSSDVLDKKVILPGNKDGFSINLGPLEKGTYKLKCSWHYISAFYMEGELDEYSAGGAALVKEFEFEIK
jgi:hypothetical protein